MESDLAAAAPLLMSVGRRCLAVVITDMMDRSTGQSLAAAVAQLRVRHATLVAMVRDPHLDDALAAPVRSPFDAYRRAAAELSARERHETLTALRARGVPALDLSMRTVALETVREYLDARWVARW